MDVEALLKSTGAILDGHFKLASGRHSDRYIEKFRIIGEDDSRSYRMATIEALPETLPDGDRVTLRQQRQRLEAVLVAAIERCHLDVAAVIAAPYAAGLASLSEDEATLGALVLDLGAGVTGVARFTDRRLQQLASLPLGAQHVTQDLAFGLSTGRAQAERLKTLYGGVLAHAGDARQQLEVPGLGDPMQPPVQIVSRARLTEIIRPPRVLRRISQLSIRPKPLVASMPPVTILVVMRVPARRSKASRSRR